MWGEEMTMQQLSCLRQRSILNRTSYTFVVINPIFIVSEPPQHFKHGSPK